MRRNEYLVMHLLGIYKLCWLQKWSQITIIYYFMSKFGRPFCSPCTILSHKTPYWNLKHATHSGSDGHCRWITWSVCACLYAHTHLSSNLYSSPSASLDFRWESSVRLAALSGIGCFRFYAHTHPLTHICQRLLLTSLCSSSAVSIQHASLVFLCPVPTFFFYSMFTFPLFYLPPSAFLIIQA